MFQKVKQTGYHISFVAFKIGLSWIVLFDLASWMPMFFHTSLFVSLTSVMQHFFSTHKRASKVLVRFCFLVWVLINRDVFNSWKFSELNGTCTFMYILHISKKLKKFKIHLFFFWNFLTSYWLPSCKFWCWSLLDLSKCQPKIFRWSLWMCRQWQLCQVSFGCKNFETHPIN